MPVRDPRIEAYIKQSPAFAQPILTRIRKIVHDACPDCDETMKWRVPHFDYRGEMLISMAAFKQHCVLGFWKAPLLIEQGLLPADADGRGFRQKIESIADLPSDAALKKTIHAAMALNDQGVKVSRPKAAPKPPVKVPPDLTAALKKHKNAFAQFQNFSPSHRREYVEWITEAKSEETRGRRVAQAIEWISQGKGRNWKYERP